MGPLWWHLVWAMSGGLYGPRPPVPSSPGDSKMRGPPLICARISCTSEKMRAYCMRYRFPLLPTGGHPMQLPLTDADMLFEDLLQDLPPTTMQMAGDFKALVRTKKVKTPEQLLRLVLLYCGLDQSLREVAGTFTMLYESITDQSVAERLRACGPWVKALLRQMFPLSAIETLPAGWRFVVIDASSIQAPGATGTDHRLHIAMDLRTLHSILKFFQVEITGMFR